MMIYSIGPNSRPFEPARSTDALREEDEFMQLHGGAGSRLIYLAVDWLASGIDAAGLRASRMWKWRRRQPCPSGRLSMDR